MTPPWPSNVIKGMKENMKPYQENLARLLAESGALFFRSGLRLKDGRPTPYFVNLKPGGEYVAKDLFEAGNKHLRPNVVAVNAVLNACAFTSGDVLEQSRAIEIAQ